MYADLPEQVQKKVLRYLEQDDFRTAKAIHDSWIQQNHPELESDNKGQH